LHTSVILEGPGIGVGDWENRGNATGGKRDRKGKGRKRKV